MRPHTPIDSSPTPDNSHASTVEIAHPTLRDHNHNVSETKGLPGSGLFDSRSAIPEDSHSAQQGNWMPSYQNNSHEGSGFDTNPSLHSTPKCSSASNGPWDGPTQHASGHQSQFWNLRFNMESSGHFQNNIFALPGTSQPAPSFGDGSGLKPLFGPVNSFNVNAPSFNLEEVNNQDVSDETKTFGDIDLPLISKPFEKSTGHDKRDENDNDNGYDAENEGRRSTHADRHEHACRGDDHYDEKQSGRVPPQAPSETSSARVSQDSNTLYPPDPPDEDKEEPAPGKDVDDITDAKTITSADDRLKGQKGTPDSKPSTWTAQYDEETGPATVHSPVKHEKGKKEPEDKQPDPKQETLINQKGELQDPQPPKRASFFTRMFIAESAPSSRETPTPTPQRAKGNQNDLMALHYAPQSPLPLVKPEQLPSKSTQTETDLKKSAQDANTPQTVKFDRLQADITTVQHDFARDQAAWRKREDEHIAKYNELRAAYAREITLREKLEQQEREIAKLKFISQQGNTRLKELVANLRLANNDLEAKAGRFEHKFNEARESSRVEIQGIRTSLESDLDAANNQVDIVRAELEAQITLLQGQTNNNIKPDAGTQYERYEMLLEQAKESKANELVGIDKQRKLDERVLNDIRKRHSRALCNSFADRQRTESYLMDRLALSEEKAQYFQDRVKHLEEKLEIKSPARVAAKRAQDRGGASVSPMHSTSPSMSYTKDSTVPDKICPQALRESILVLQDQLQQREARIEELEQEVSFVDKDAPNRLKEKDTEINWLRELLGVRIDDLQDIINTLSQPSFDQGAVLDAAIRLRANLQMQLEEKERALAGQSFPSRSVSGLAVSSRSLPMAAVTAFSNWRKGGEHAGSNASKQTSSKPSNTGQNALVALQTWSESRLLNRVSSTLRPFSARGDRSMLEPLKTPPLFRKSTYDDDAKPTNYEHRHNNFEEDGESTVNATSPERAVEDHLGLKY